MSATLTASAMPARLSRPGSTSMNAESLMTAAGGSKVPSKVLDAECIDAVLHADAGVVLREHRGRNADVADAAMRCRRDKADEVEHGSATDRDDIRVTVEPDLDELSLQLRHQRRLVLRALAAFTIVIGPASSIPSPRARRRPRYGGASPASRA